MAAFMDNSSLDVSERNLMAITLNIHTKSHTVCSRPTLKLFERFGNGSIRKLYERSIYERSFTGEPSIRNIKRNRVPAHVNTTMHLDVIEYQKLLWNVSKEGKETKGICLWAYSSKLTEVLLATSLCEG